MTPWCERVTLISSSLRRSTSTTGMSAALASRIMRPSAGSSEPRLTYILSMGRSALSASLIALRPSMRSCLGESISLLSIYVKPPNLLPHNDTFYTIPQNPVNIKYKLMEPAKFSPRGLPSY